MKRTTLAGIPAHTTISTRLDNTVQYECSRTKRLWFASFEQALKFSKGDQILLAACGSFRPDQPGKIERRDLASECFHRYRVLLYVVKTAQACNFCQEIDLTDVSLKRKHSSVA